MEITAVVPALSDDFTVEPIFVGDALGKPLVWTDALPEVPPRVGLVIGQKSCCRVS